MILYTRVFSRYSLPAFTNTNGYCVPKKPVQ